MKKIFILLVFAGLSCCIAAQPSSRKFTSISFMNTQTAYPFGKLAGMFYTAFHPGMEFSYGKNFSIRKKHDWYYDFRIAYFYHRFVQHGIPLYFNSGYRYKFKKRFSLTAEAGAGYMHSIPATAKLKLNSEGNYENNKGVGRMQGIACFAFGAGYMLNPEAKSPLKLFLNYQQRLQLPFVKSYVPVLPYNSLMLGVSKPFQIKKHK